MAVDLSQHPCFNADAHGRFGRIHLPVAPRCNLGCNFCNRKYDCLNESRPGVTSTVLSPTQAGRYLDRVLELFDEPIRVVGIAGPGDPFANPNETLATLRLVREAHPEMILCIATNGLAVGPHVAELAELRVSHVTITVNAVDADIGERVYRFVRPEKLVHRGRAGAEALLERQLEAIRLLKAHGLTVKVNSIVMPGVNDHHIEDIARTVASLGADVHNCMALIPVAETPFADLVEPDNQTMQAIRARSLRHLPQMTHCARCRADAAGILGEDNHDLVRQVLEQAAREPDEPSVDRPYVAVASYEGVLVNQHLGQSEQLWIYERRAAEDFRLVQTRPTPLPGSGGERWEELARRLGDCRALLCSSAGARPKLALAQRGVRVLVAEGLVCDALEAVYTGRKPPSPVHAMTSAASCGGCAGPGTGCG